MDWLRRQMMGRYGGDQLNFALIILSLILNFIPFWVLRYVSLVILAWAVFRMLSRNIYRRQQENRVFLKVWFPVQRFFKKLFGRRPDAKTHRRFRCPKCKQEVRVPRNLGKISITCPKCGEKFIKKT